MLEVNDLPEVQGLVKTSKRKNPKEKSPRIKRVHDLGGPKGVPKLIKRQRSHTTTKGPKGV